MTDRRDRPSPAPPAPPKGKVSSARAELDQLLSRYDHGALPPGIAARVAKLQADIAWEQHRRSSADPPEGHQK